jgi:L-2-hydroxycarboxylate dehydrogenase (NAD+)
MPSYAEIERLGCAALLRAGVPRDHAEQQLNLLLEAQLRGYASHGLLRLPRIIERIGNAVVDPSTKGRCHWRGLSFLEVDGAQGLGPIVVLHALDQVAERARETGIAVAAISNCDHLGMLAWYADKIASQGQILLALTISEALVHPWGGRQALLGTNPIAIGVPASPRPFVFDMATSIAPMGKIHDYAERGQPLPPGWALDEEGHPTIDAAAAKSGALAPFGGAKGYGLGLAFEVLVGALTACALGPAVRGTLDSTEPCNKGDVFIIIEPAAGVSASVSDFLNVLRMSSPTDPGQPVRVPGDRAHAERQRRIGQEIELPAPLWARIIDLAGLGRALHTAMPS